MSYTPSQEILDKYADLLINFALNSGEGVKPGEVVWTKIDEPAKPMYAPIRNAILKAGAMPLMDFIPSGVNVSEEYELSSPEQFFHQQ